MQETSDDKKLKLLITLGAILVIMVCILVTGSVFLSFKNTHVTDLKFVRTESPSSGSWICRV